MLVLREMEMQLVHPLPSFSW